MMQFVRTAGILSAAAIAISAIAAVSAASAQVYTKGGFVEQPQTVISKTALSSDVGSVTYVTPPTRTIVPTATTTTTITRAAVPAAVPLTSFAPSASSGVAAIALGPVVSPRTGIATASHSQMQMSSGGGMQQVSAGGQCNGGRAVQAFQSPTINFRGVDYAYTPTPPLSFAGGAALAAIYPSMSGQSEICYSGACISGPAGSCGAIAVAQPGGRMRVYVR